MPHLVLDGTVDFKSLTTAADREAQRWGAAVFKTEELWLRSDGKAMLAEGVVVEHSRPLHPVALISHQKAQTSVRLWRLAAAERTPAVQRWLATLASAAQAAGCGPVVKTNLSAEVIEGLSLEC
jgi:hypothetical protein